MRAWSYSRSYSLLFNILSMELHFRMRSCWQGWYLSKKSNLDWVCTLIERIRRKGTLAHPFVSSPKAARFESMRLSDQLFRYSYKVTNNCGSICFFFRSVTRLRRVDRNWSFILFFVALFLRSLYKSRAESSSRLLRANNKSLSN